MTAMFWRGLFARGMVNCSKYRAFLPLLRADVELFQYLRVTPRQAAVVKGRLLY